MKVYFDVITNHTADVIRYQEGAGTELHLQGSVSVPDRRGHRVRRPRLRGREHVPGAGADRSAHLPAVRPAPSFPYHPCVPAAEQNVKVPAWLNDVSLYHNRGNTTFAGENSQYGDFFGLDDLFTENPRVVDGMLDIYKFWIREFRVDGFRMDTMKHVDDPFWQRFAPEIERYARAQGIRDFYMFGEVAEDFDVGITSHYPIHDDVQGVLDFLFQMSAVDFAGEVAADELAARLLPQGRLVHRRRLERLQPADLPRQPRPRADRHVHPQRQPGRERGRAAAPRPARARAHVLLARQPGHLLRRRAGLHRRGRRPGRAAGHVPAAETSSYDNVGDAPARTTTSAPTRRRWTTTSTRAHPLYRRITRLARVTERYPDAARRRAAAPLLRPTRPGSTRSRASAGASTWWRSTTRRQPASASVPTYMRSTKWEKVFGRGPDRAWSGSRPQARRHAAGAVGGRLPREGPLPRSKHGAVGHRCRSRPTGRDRLEVGARASTPTSSPR